MPNPSWRVIAALLAPLLGGSARSAPPPVPAASAEPEMIPTGWLDAPLTVAEAEAAHPGVTDDRVKRFPELGLPFGGLHREWEALKAEMRPGDTLRTFASPPDSWQHLAGRAGIALLRDGRVIRTIVTQMN